MLTKLKVIGLIGVILQGVRIFVPELPAAEDPMVAAAIVWVVNLLWIAPALGAGYAKREPRANLDKLIVA